MGKKKFVIELDKDQAKIMSIALEIATRMYLGQVDKAVDLSMVDISHHDRKDIEAAQDASNLVKFILTGHERNSSYGIGCDGVKKVHNEVYDMLQQIRHAVWESECSSDNRGQRYHCNSAYVSPVQEKQIKVKSENPNDK